MTSKVLMKLPTVPFPQGKKAPPDLVSLNERNDGLVHIRHQGLNVDRVMQLEQNMKFLQEQHQATLVALHQEIESLRQRNRDLQFQLVFSKRAHCGVPSSPSSPEDNGNGFAKSKGSPICVNVAPLQVELLEKDLQDIKASLQEAKTQNQYLSNIIEQQKKRLDATEEQNKIEEKNKIEVADAAIQVGDPVQASLVVLLEESYAMVKRLHKENLDQKKEIASLRAASANNAGSSRGGRSRDGNNGHHSRGSPTSTTQEQSSRKFPPLPIPSYWHRRSPRYSTNRHEKQDHQTEAESTVLPQLQNGSVKSAPEAASFESTSYRSREYRNYGRDGNRKYRGQASRRDSNHYYHSRDFKDRNAKDHPRDAEDTGESSKGTDNHHHRQ
ncbi:hypothetical protein DMN91_001636 [Ooceraea biroi]|uniref:CCDC92/74 N-terminal domain-containing protein n=1 Tax=Ooceraea biroi TaxID=2015173 RepID=A0A026WF89_OOCBI|nr:uncharacterized protein LOC105280089 [Ooceraea biroi]XP_011338607.1 uncharacterized protein LOC105280089 [Ooceraea biroi]XP_011338608.1 uncharacterized protein LOC105280089 [Ooceraea biroi]XP_011338609.1 uncharacterized protein LOC105280089 [Ooceraea biroi]EZA54351.1 hypothetical protein X777_05581 [Ooceraea biroi]RLU25480.1 hypothetical protein DMN91_001636 [Ooceraea biroi]